MKRGIVILAVMLLFCPAAQAVPLFYNVSGTATINPYTPAAIPNLELSGQMYLNDEVDMVQGGLGPRFDNEVLFFNFAVGPYAFWGSGNIYSDYYPDKDHPEFAFTCPFDTLHLLGNGAWSNWEDVAYHVDYYYADGTAFDKGPVYSDFLNVPYRIFAEHIVPMTSGGSFGSGYIEINNFEIIHAGAAAPVPEPCTLLFMTVGIAGIAAQRKLSKIHR